MAGDSRGGATGFAIGRGVAAAHRIWKECQNPESISKIPFGLRDLQLSKSRIARDNGEKECGVTGEPGGVSARVGGDGGWRPGRQPRQRGLTKRGVIL